MTRAHSYGKFLSNSAGQFAKFCGSLGQNCLNSAVYRSPPFVHKLSSILTKKLHFLEDGISAQLC